MLLANKEEGGGGGGFPCKQEVRPEEEYGTNGKMAAVQVDKMANERVKAKMATEQSHSHTLMPANRGELLPRTAPLPSSLSSSMAMVPLRGSLSISMQPMLERTKLTFRHS